MTVAKEVLMAYVDGELPVGEMARVEAEIAADPELHRYVEQQRRLQQTLHNAFDPILATPVPEALTRAAGKRRGWRIDGWQKFALWSGLPAAAALACGLLIGLVFRDGDIATSNGMLVARDGLAQALSNGLAAEQTAKAEIGLTFRDRSNRYCRTFSTPSLAGVACRESNGWQIAAMGNADPESGGVYRPAGSAMPDFVRSTVKAMISGEPLDAAAERKARAAGWR